METIKAIEILKRDKASGPKGLHPYFKDSGEVPTSKLTKPPGPIREKERIPKDRC